MNAEKKWLPENTTIVLDLHDVVFRMSWSGVLQELVRTPRLVDLVPLAFNIPLWYDAVWSLRNKKVVEQMLERLAAKHPSFARVHETAFKMVNRQKPVPGMVEILQQLRARTYELVIFSNIGGRSVQALKEQHPQVFKLFDKIVHANHCDGYIAKPAPAAFEKFFAVCGREKRYIFIDDTPKNLAQARVHQMHTVRFVNAAQLLHELRQLNILKR